MLFEPLKKCKWLIALAAVTMAATATGADFLVFFGTYSNSLSKGIYASRLDAATGKLSAPELVAQTPSPCFLAVSPDEKFLYAANSVRNFSDADVTNAGAVSAFAIDKASGSLTFLNQKCSGGEGPCHVSVDATGKVLFIANYGDGSVKSFSLETNGAIGAAGPRLARIGHSVNANRQASAHAHFIHADPSNRFALVCDLGTDELISFPFDVRTAELNASRFEVAGVPDGSGARHLAFSPGGKFIYVLGEMGCCISRFVLDEKGCLFPYETISVLPPGAVLQENFTAAEILTSKNDVYATIRGHDSISVLAADPATGRLSFLQNISSGGKVPRGLGIDPTGRWLLVGNQGTDNVVEYAIDPQTGRLTPAGRQLKVGAPVDVKFVRMN